LLATAATPSLDAAPSSDDNREVLMNLQVVLIVALAVVLVVLLALRGKSKPGAGGGT